MAKRAKSSGRSMKMKKKTGTTKAAKRSAKKVVKKSAKTKTRKAPAKSRQTQAKAMILKPTRRAKKPASRRRVVTDTPQPPVMPEMPATPVPQARPAEAPSDEAIQRMRASWQAAETRAEKAQTKFGDMRATIRATASRTWSNRQPGRG